MRSVLRHIMSTKRAYARLAFFRFLEDESFSPRERLSFMPGIAAFIMDFGDLNRFVLRDESSNDPLQLLVNAHSREDDHHWPWYLDDLATLGHDQLRRPTDVLRDLYDDRTTATRQLASTLAHLIDDATPTERLVIIEAIEETGNVLFERTAALARRIEREEQIELRYLGDFHLALESGHARDGDDHRTLGAIELGEGDRARCIHLVDQVFGLFAGCVGELLDYALTELRRPVGVAG